MNCGHQPDLLGVLEAFGWHIVAFASCGHPPRHASQALCVVRARSKQYCASSAAGPLALSTLYIVNFLMKGSDVQPTHSPLHTWPSAFARLSEQCSGAPGAAASCTEATASCRAAGTATHLCDAHSLYEQVSVGPFLPCRAARCRSSRPTCWATRWSGRLQTFAGSVLCLSRWGALLLSAWHVCEMSAWQKRVQTNPGKETLPSMRGLQPGWGPVTVALLVLDCAGLHGLEALMEQVRCRAPVKCAALAALLHRVLPMPTEVGLLRISLGAARLTTQHTSPAWHCCCAGPQGAAGRAGGAPEAAAARRRQAACAPAEGQPAADSQGDRPAGSPEAPGRHAGGRPQGGAAGAGTPDCHPEG